MAYNPHARSAEQTQLLDGLVDRARDSTRSGQPATAVFDLDGCLFDNRPRQIHILREFASQHGIDEMWQVQIEHFESWDIARTLRNSGMSDDRIAAVKEPFERYWHRQFFRSSYCLYDVAMPGAPQLIWDIYRTGTHIIYLTGRDETMRAGTEECLVRFGFPLHRPRTTLILKPDFATEDAGFKKEALREIRTVGRPIIFLDNEPTNLNIFRDEEPDATVVMLDTDHSPAPTKPYDSIPRVPGFLR